MSPPTSSTPKATGALVSVAVYDSAAAAVRRAGFEPTRSRVRAVVRAREATGEAPTEDFDWWDRLVRQMPHGARRPRKVATRAWAVSS